MSVGEHDTVIRVLLVNGESRSVRLDPRTEVAVSYNQRIINKYKYIYIYIYIYIYR